MRRSASPRASWSSRGTCPITGWARDFESRRWWRSSILLFELQIAAAEVHDAFEVPLRFILDAANHKPRQLRMADLTVRSTTFPYGERIIWGATAGMLMTFRRSAAGPAGGADRRGARRGEAAVTSRLPELLSIMERLRATDGCPWDRRADLREHRALHRSRRPTRWPMPSSAGDLAHLKDELGDLLFQVVFHAHMASEQGAFDFEAVAGRSATSCVRRHPHVFGGHGSVRPSRPADGRRSSRRPWRGHKARQRGAESALDGVPRALPAFMRAVQAEQARRPGRLRLRARLADRRQGRGGARGGARSGRRTAEPSRHAVRTRRRRRPSRKSATCCSPPPISPASSASMPRAHCAPRM